MDQDRIWSRVQTGQPGRGFKPPATAEAIGPAQHGVDAARVARLRAERDEALAEAGRMRRAYEAARQTVAQERDEAWVETERLRRALEIAHHAAECERDMARRERARMEAQMNAQQKLAEEHVRPEHPFLSWLFGRRRPSPAHARQGAPSADQPGLIKGNVNRRGERIYHLPGGHWYNRTKIDPSMGDRWFRTEDEAKAAGWRAAKR